MLYNIFTLLSLITFTFGLKRSFTPSEPENLEYSKDKIWMWLDRECFTSKDEVFTFRDELLSNYECLKYDNKKHHRVFYTGENDSMWSLWLDLNNNNNDFKCLNKIIELNNYDTKCINKIVYEPLQHKTDDLKSFTKENVENLLDRLKPTKKIQAQSCNTQVSWGGFSYDEMSTLDIMDGTIDGEYRNNNAAASVAAIILDEGVWFQHVEFTGLSTGTLDNFDLSTINQFNHGTHVAGTVVGLNMGGAKNVQLLNYPVCQGVIACRWNDIETGYNAAIALMQANPNTRYVINYSVGGSKSAETTPQYNSWGNQIDAAGGIWVTSAGNSNGDACDFSPAYNTNALTIGAITKSGNRRASFSNYGSCVDFWAPGELVMSSLPDNAYGTMSGTSMSSPGICGLAINLIRDNPSITQSQMRSQMMAIGNYYQINEGSNTAPNNYAPFYNGCN